ncbi:MAG TPA: efflux RND transporter periplasmic adaptor subunit, partial [Gemmatimonadales bacterium]
MRTMTLSLILLALAACGKQEAASPMEGMTAEEHAKMMAGGTQGAVDTAGQVLRQPVRLTLEQEQALGVRYITVTRAPTTRTIRTVGQIQAPEPGIAEITPKVDGFVERLFVSSTGDPVRKGQPLLSLYSPMVVAAQEELLSAHRLANQLQGVGGDATRNATVMLEAARRRLAWWDVPAEAIAEVERSGLIQRTVTLASPVNGVVLEKMVVQGQQVMAGMRLYRVADLSTVWIEGEVFEQDLRYVQRGVEAHIEVSAYPDEHLMGEVSFVYPTVDQASRTNRVRVVVPNPGLRLKPGMFATVYIDVALDEALMVPTGAVLVTGERNLVFVREADGTLTPREVVLGGRTAHQVEVLSGLEEGERIVVSANFLVDAESQLGGGVEGMPGMQHGPDGQTGGRA